MHPVLFELPTSTGPLPLYSHGALLGIALIAGWYLVLARTRRLGIADTPVQSALVAAALGAVLGSRLGFMALFPERAAEAWSWTSGAGSTWGAIGGALLAGSVALRALPRPTRGHIADAAAPAFGVAITLASLGCWLHGCAPGANGSQLYEAGCGLTIAALALLGQRRGGRPGVLASSSLSAYLAFCLFRLGFG